VTAASALPIRLRRRHLATLRQIQAMPRPMAPRSTPRITSPAAGEPVGGLGDGDATVPGAADFAAAGSAGLGVVDVVRGEPLLVGGWESRERF
jgi:hypothetical protein